MAKAPKRLTPKKIKENLAKLKGERGNFEIQWQEITDLMAPRKNNVITKRSPGEKRNVQVLDNTPMVSSEMLAGALHGFLTNPYGDWFEYTTGDLKLDQQDDVRLWLQDSARRTNHVINASNFQTEVHELYQDLTTICTACMYLEEDKRDIVRFSTKFIGDFYINENNKGFVDEIYREWRWTADQIIAEFGKEKMPDVVMKSYEKGDGQTFLCMHAVYPSTKLDPDGNGFQSQYILADQEIEIKTAKYLSFPYMVPRWAKAAGEKYGRGPGFNALPEAKVLNKMNETMLIGAQKVVDPPIQMEDDGVILPIITRPGGINFRRPGSDPIRPVFNDTRMDFGYQAMEDRRKRIRDAFYVDQLKLQQGGPMMTATEVMQRTEEAMRLLGPMLGRMQIEFLRPLIDRVFDIMLRRGLFLPVPEVLKGKTIEVRYSSFIAKAQRMNESQNIVRAFQALQPFLVLDPATADNFDGDGAARMVAYQFSLPAELMRRTDDVAKRREAKAQAAQAAAKQQQNAQFAETAAKTAQTVESLSAANG